MYSALFPINVFDLKRVMSFSSQNVFTFRIANNFNNETRDVSWVFDIGNGTLVDSTYDVTLEPREEVFVYFAENYTDGDIYEVNATAISGNLSDSETMTIPIGDTITYDLNEIYTNSKERVFAFKIYNNMESEKALSWSLNTGETEITSDYLTYLDPGEEVFVYVHNDYVSGGTYVVNATATNVNDSITDSTKDIVIIVRCLYLFTGVGRGVPSLQNFISAHFLFSIFSESFVFYCIFDSGHDSVCCRPGAGP